jgi:hypothetical protein
MYVSAALLNPMLLEGDWVIGPSIVRACIRGQSYGVLHLYVSVYADLLNPMLLEGDWIIGLSVDRTCIRGQSFGILHLFRNTWSAGSNTIMRVKRIIPRSNERRSHSVLGTLTTLYFREPRRDFLPLVLRLILKKEARSCPRHFSWSQR